MCRMRSTLTRRRKEVGRRARHGLRSPLTAGLLTRLAYARAKPSRTRLAALLRKSGLTPHQIEDSSARLPAGGQLEFVNQLAEMAGDSLLGFHLARTFELREVGLFYYVLASSER